MTAFVLGNGKSRLIFNLEKLQKLGTTYGCNAIYRDFIPDHLVAVDGKMIKEFANNGVDELTNIWVQDKATKTKKMKMFPKEIRQLMGAGLQATMLACSHGHKKVYMLGFDLHPEHDVMGLNYFNNVYAGTENYKGIKDQPPLSARYINKFRKIALTMYPEVEFIRAYDSKYKYIPEVWQNLSNVSHTSNVELKKLLEV